MADNPYHSESLAGQLWAKDHAPVFTKETLAGFAILVLALIIGAHLYIDYQPQIDQFMRSSAVALNGIAKGISAFVGEKTDGFLIIADALSRTEKGLPIH